MQWCPLCRGWLAVLCNTYWGQSEGCIPTGQRKNAPRKLPRQWTENKLIWLAKMPMGPKSRRDGPLLSRTMFRLDARKARLATG